MMPAPPDITSPTFIMNLHPGRDQTGLNCFTWSRTCNHAKSSLPKRSTEPTALLEEAERLVAAIGKKGARLMVPG